MTSPIVRTLTDIADDLDAAVAAIGDVRGRRERDDLVFVLARIRDTATKPIETVGKKRRARPPTTDAGFDTENDWSDIITHMQ